MGENRARRGELESAELAREVVNAISERKGADILMLDIRPVSLIADYFVICSGVNERHLKAIIEEVTRRLDEAGVNPLHTEGVPSSGWVILDYNSVIVHIFAPAERQYYSLERLWSDAKVVVKMQ